jgi:hypothetical protein
VSESFRAPGRNFTPNETCKKLNPKLFSALAAVESPKRKPDPKPALGKDLPAQQKGKGRLAVCIIGFRKRLLDDDNFTSGGNKAIRDAIAQSIGIDDGDPIFDWQYRQVLTSGQEGTLVKIDIV